MAIYLDERQIGFDTTTVGFPNLGDCMGAVVQVGGGLFGFHIYGLGGAMDPTFAQFIRQHFQFQDDMTHLYGSCYRPRRYGGGGNTSASWRAEMKALADALGYTGPISGIDTSVGTRIKRTETTYVEYRLGGHNQCQIYYKRMSKMQNPTLGPLSPGTDVKLIRKDMAEMKRQGKTHDDEPIYMAANLPGHATTGMNIKTTRSNKGQMHQSKVSRIETFDYDGT